MGKQCHTQVPQQCSLANLYPQTLLKLTKRDGSPSNTDRVRGKLYIETVVPNYSRSEQRTTRSHAVSLENISFEDTISMIKRLL